MEPSTASWVKSSTVKIQEMIRDFVMDSLHKAKGTKISDIELRSAANRAFNFVYDDASLRNAITVAPEILPILKTMQGKKNLTHGPKFQDTLNRTFLALGGMFPGTTEEFTSGVKLPDFKTSLKMAFNRSSETYNDEIKLDKILYEVSLNLMAGKLDNKEILQFLVNNLKFKMFVDERHNHMSREICIKANLRLNLIETYYTPLIAIRPNLAGLLN